MMRIILESRGSARRLTDFVVISVLTTAPRPDSNKLRSQLTSSQELKNKLRLSAELQQQQQQHGAVPPAPPSGGVTTGDVEPPIDGRDTPAVAPPPPPPEGGHYQYTPRPCPPKELPGRPEDMPQEQQEDLADGLFLLLLAIRNHVFFL
jgi:hypothetical protein